MWVLEGLTQNYLVQMVKSSLNYLVVSRIWNDYDIPRYLPYLMTPVSGKGKESRVGVVNRLHHDTFSKLHK